MCLVPSWLMLENSLNGLCGCWFLCGASGSLSRKGRGRVKAFTPLALSLRACPGQTASLMWSWLSSESAPSDLGWWQVLLVLRYCSIPCPSFVNIPFIHFSSNCPVWSCQFCCCCFFFFIFKLYITVLVLPNIKMNPPRFRYTNKGSS